MRFPTFRPRQAKRLTRDADTAAQRLPRLVLFDDLGAEVGRAGIDWLPAGQAGPAGEEAAPDRVWGWATFDVIVDRPVHHFRAAYLNTRSRPATVIDVVTDSGEPVGPGRFTLTVRPTLIAREGPTGETFTIDHD